MRSDKHTSRVRTLALAAVLGAAALAGCDQFSPTDVKNPNLTDEDFLKTPNAAAAWVRGVERQFLTTLNTFISNSEIMSDNYYNNYTTGSKVFDTPRLDHEDAEVQGLQASVARLREVADFGIKSVLPADSTSTPQHEAELLFLRGMSRLFSGEYFVGLPEEPRGPVVGPDVHLRAAIADFERGRTLNTNAALRNRYTAALARTHYRLGDKAKAVAEAQALLAAAPTFLQNAAYDGVNGPGNGMTGVLTSSVNNYQPLPRMDFLDPKFPNRGATVASPLAFLKAEESHMIIAEAQLSDGNVNGAKATMQALLALVNTRPREQVDSRLQLRGRAGGLKIYPNTSDTKVAFSPGAPMREGLVLTRQGPPVTVPTVSGTSVTSAQIDAIATHDEALYTLYLMRQEIFLAEGRRAVDIGLRAPVALTEVLANPNAKAGEPYTSPQIPPFLPGNFEIDAFTYNEAAKTVVINVDVNRLIVQNKTSPFILPFHQ